MSKPKQDPNLTVPTELIQELLTPSEWRMIKLRLLIIKLLEQGLSIRVVAREAKVGTDTVMRMSKKLEESPRLRAVFKKNKDSETKPKWVFGKTAED